MSKKQNAVVAETGQKAYARYASVEVDGRTWDFEIPVYLDGGIKAGDHVVVRREGEYAVGSVLGLKASTEHRPENVRMLVDKVREKRYLRLVERRSAENDLLAAAERRAEKLDGISILGAMAESDLEMSRIMAALADVSDDPALS